MDAEQFQQLVDGVARAIDAAGVLVIVGGLLWATVTYARGQLASRPGVYRRYRRDVGMAILLGLEFLVAADIIKTVAVEATFSGIGVLALLVLVRTFLSFTLQLEVEGRWPWQRRPEPAAAAAGEGV